MKSNTIYNALTVDVEDYFHVSAFDNYISPLVWDTMESRVAANTRHVLELFSAYDLKATFFILGWVAQRHPTLVREIADRGHEVACHGMGHQRIHTQTPEQFRKDVSESKALLEDLAGTSVAGYRAPSYSITNRSLWALDILIELGFAYDSSIFPIIHDLYGIPEAYPHPHRIVRTQGSILEFPLSTFRIDLGNRTLALPASGGGYLRLFPSRFFTFALSRINIKEKQPGVLYFHPWELDPAQPRIKTGLKSRFRHYLNLDKTESRLRLLFEELPFAPMQTALEACLSLPLIHLKNEHTAPHPYAAVKPKRNSHGI